MVWLIVVAPWSLVLGRNSHTLHQITLYGLANACLLNSLEAAAEPSRTADVHACQFCNCSQTRSVLAVYQLSNIGLGSLEPSGLWAGEVPDLLVRWSI